MSNSKKVFSHLYRDNRLHTGQIREPNSHQLWHDELQKCSQIFPLTVGSCVLIGKLGQDLVENSCRGRVFWVSCWHTCCDLYKNRWAQRGHGTPPKSRISSKSNNRWQKYGLYSLTAAAFFGLSRDASLSPNEWHWEAVLWMVHGQDA